MLARQDFRRGTAEKPPCVGSLGEIPFRAERGESAVCVGSPEEIPFRAEREESAAFADARRENRESAQTVRKSQTGRKKKDKL